MGFTLVSTLAFTQTSGNGATTGSPPGSHLIGMWKQPYFLEVLFASVFGWVLGMVKGFSGSQDWLTKYFPNRPRIVNFLLDLLIFVVCGAFIGTGIYHPDSLQAAIAAGLSWPVGLGALVTK
jgi:hypothetical protein